MLPKRTEILLLEEAFRELMEAMSPQRRFAERVSCEGSTLRWTDGSVDLADFDRVWIFGAGKAAGGLAHAASKLVEERLAGGVVICADSLGNERGIDIGNQSFTQENLRPVSGLKFLPGDHPLPEKNSVASTSELLETAKHVTNRDLVLFMITGGASAMLCKPESGISLSEKQSIHTKLLRSGASIHEMNCVRKHLSAVKGGKLIAHFNGAKILNFIVSDVPGDDATTIGSGPTNADPTSCHDAQTVLRKYSIDAAPNFVETPKPGEVTPPVNIWITTPAQSASYMSEILQAKGFRSIVDKQAYRGDVHDVVAKIMTDIERNAEHPAPTALVYYGESEVHVEGNGSGGRNQHLALLLAFSLSKSPFSRKITALSAGTDGIDGNSDVAGAIISESTVVAAREKGLNPSDYLQNFDSSTFFSKLGAILKTGPTGNNLMDIQVILIHN